MTSRLLGITAFITGAARGIGAAFAKPYAREGATIFRGDNDLEAAGKTAASIGKNV